MKELLDEMAPLVGEAVGQGRVPPAFWNATPGDFLCCVVCCRRGAPFHVPGEDEFEEEWGPDSPHYYGVSLADGRYFLWHMESLVLRTSVEELGLFYTLEESLAELDRWVPQPF